MKKTFYSLLVILALISPSCTNEDVSESSLIGEWQVANAYIEAETNLNSATEKLEENKIVYDYESMVDGTLLLKEDKTYIISYKNSFDYGSYKVENKRLILESEHFDGREIYYCNFKNQQLNLHHDLTEMVKENLEHFIESSNNESIIINKVELKIELSKRN